MNNKRYICTNPENCAIIARSCMWIGCPYNYFILWWFRYRKFRKTCKYREEV